MHWEFGVFSWFFLLSHCRQLGKYSSYKDGCTEPAWWSHRAVFPERFPSCQQTYLSILRCFLFKLFRQSSSLNFHFEVQLAFPEVGIQSSTTHWGKASPFVHFCHLLWFDTLWFFWWRRQWAIGPFPPFPSPHAWAGFFCCSLPSPSPCLQSSYWNLVYLGLEIRERDVVRQGW